MPPRFTTLGLTLTGKQSEYRVKEEIARSGMGGHLLGVS